MKVSYTAKWKPEVYVTLDNASRESIREICSYIVEEAQSIVSVRSGYLHDNIRIDKLSAKEGMVVADTDYAMFVEYGTSKMAAQPFMRPIANRTIEIENLSQEVMNRHLR